MLETFIKSHQQGPRGNQARFQILPASVSEPRSLPKLGTYGFIRNPAGFIVGALKPSDRCLEDYGYLLESIILAATAMGLGTCWLGGSFTRSEFAGAIDAQPGETVPAVVAVGYPAGKTRTFESIIRWGMKAKRKTSAP